MAWLCGVNGLVVWGESSAIVIVHRTPPDRIASTTRSDFERHPIRLRPPPDWIASAAANSCSSFTFRNITFYTT